MNEKLKSMQHWGVVYRENYFYEDTSSFAEKNGEV